MYHFFDYKKYTNDTWQIDCKEMVLAKNDNSPSDSYSGPGYIRKNTEGIIEFKIYSNKTPNISKFVPSNTKAGQLIPKEENYALKAVDIEGLEWFSDFILPDCSGPVSSNNIVVVGGLRFIEMSFETDYDDVIGNTISFIFNEDIDFPCNKITKKKEIYGDTFNEEDEAVASHSSYNMDRADFSSCGLKFSLHKENHCTVYSIISSSKSISKFDEYRCLEALQYVLSRPLNWIISEKEGNKKHRVQIQSTSSKRVNNEYYAPYRKYFRGDVMWSLFDRYLSYIINYQEGVK